MPTLGQLIDPRIPHLATQGFLRAIQGGADQSGTGMQAARPLTVDQSLAQIPDYLRLRVAEQEADTEKARADAYTAGLSTLIKEAELRSRQWEWIPRVLQTIGGPEDYEIAMGALDKIDPDARQLLGLGETYDPVALREAQQFGLSAAEFERTRAEGAKLMLGDEPMYGFLTYLTALPDDAEEEAKQAHWASTVQTFGHLIDPRVGRRFQAYSPELWQYAKQLRAVGQQATEPKTEKSPTAGSFEDYVTRMAREKGVPPEQLTTADIELARKKYQQADDRPTSVTVGGGAFGPAFDPDVVAEAIREGNATPLESGYSRGQWGQITTSLFKKDPKFPLQAAQRDYRGVQQLVRTLNQNQQVKLRQAITKAKDSLAILQERVAAFNGGQFRAVNRAKLAWYAEGLGGQKNQSNAVLLQGQINDAIGELAQVLQQGGVPTDQARTMAAENFNSAWSKQTLYDAIDQVKRNMAMALHAIETTGPLGVSPDSPYLPPLKTGIDIGGVEPTTSAPKPTHRYNPRTKRIEKIQ